MPAEQFPSIPQFELSTITEQDLQKPVVGKIVAKRCLELEAECRLHISQIDTERRERDRITNDFHLADSKRQVLETKLEVLNNRDAVSQVLWGATAIVIAMMIDSGRSQQWTYFSLCVAATALLICAQLWLHGFSSKTKNKNTGKT